MQETILIVYLVVAIALVGIILLQQGKGAEMGASFGAGGANTVFGAAGSGNALTKTTTILAILFFGIALSISYLNSAPPEVVDDIFDDVPAIEKKGIESEIPTAPSAPDALESEVAPVDSSPSDSAPVDSTAADNLENVDKKNVESQLAPKEKAEKTKEQPKKEDDGQ